MSRCPEESFEENFFLQKIKNFDHFRSLTGKYFGFLAKTLHHGCQKGILGVLGNVLSNFLGKKNMYLITILKILSKKNVGILAKNPTGLSKLSLTVPEEFFEVLLRKKAFTSSVSHFEHKTDRVVKNAIWMSRRTFWGQTLFGKNICSFWSFLDFESLFYRNFDENTSVRLSSLHSTCPGEESEWKQFSRENFFFFIILFLVKILLFLAKKSQQGRHLHCWYPQRSTAEKKDFFSRLKFQILFVLWLKRILTSWRKKYRQGCQNCILCVQGNVLRNFTVEKEIFEKIVFFSFSYFDLTNFLPFGKERSAGLQKVKFWW